MTDALKISPFQHTLKGSLKLPGSKSITNRALITAALSKGLVRLEGALFSRDTLIMIEALNALGFEIAAEPLQSGIQIKGLSGAIPNKKAALNVGNAGTAARFITAFLALQDGGEYFLDGDPQMRDRPMKGLLDALVKLGAAEFIFTEKAGHFPFKMITKGYRISEAAVDASSSSQILSALLLSLPAASQDTTLKCPNVREAYIKVTEHIKVAFGATQLAEDTPGAYIVKSQGYEGPESGCYAIEPDLSAASYFLALTLLHGGNLSIENLGEAPIQGDAEFANILKLHGLEVQPHKAYWSLKRPFELTTMQAPLELDFTLFSDTFLTYAAIAPLISSNVTLRGIAHTRHQETDRVSAMAKELKKLGQSVTETEDSLQIISDLKTLKEKALAARASGSLLKIETYEDHRFAMSFGILGTYDLLGDGLPWLAIEDADCCSKTFPDFFNTLAQLKHASHS